MKKAFSFLFLFVAVLLFAKLSFAQTATNSAGINVTFPIAELGNCSSAASCKTYCDDPTHLDACIAYAKAHGFYKESSLDTEKETVLADAKTTLGCDSLDSCRAFCQQAANADACSAFAQKHNLKGGKQTHDSVTLEKAKTTLGCDSIDSCKTFCEQQTNKSKCASFARENGLHGGDETVGPGGCTSEDSCKVFCSNPSNFQVCQQFMQTKVGSDSAEHTFTGPGGCSSQQACQSFCDKNPEDCHLNPEGHEAPMSATAAARIQDKEDCREHPEKCRPSGVPSESSRPVEEGRNNFRPGNQHGPIPSGIPQGINPQNIEGGNSGREGTSGGGSGGSEQPKPTETVEGASTSRNFFQWALDQLFHLR